MKKRRYLCRQSRYFFASSFDFVTPFKCLSTLCLPWQPNEQQIEKSLKLSAKIDGFRRDLRLVDCVVVCGNSGCVFAAYSSNLKSLFLLDLYYFAQISHINEICFRFAENVAIM